jgi:hypothetical protein
MIFYVTYFGLPLAMRRQRPIHSEREKDIAPDIIAAQYPELKIEHLSIASMPRREFFAKVWPK